MSLCTNCGRVPSMCDDECPECHAAYLIRFPEEYEPSAKVPAGPNAGKRLYSMSGWREAEAMFLAKRDVA